MSALSGVASGRIEVADCVRSCLFTNFGAGLSLLVSMLVSDPALGLVMERISSFAGGFVTGARTGLVVLVGEGLFRVVVRLVEESVVGSL